jgi:hypothetical protein
VQLGLSVRLVLLLATGLCLLGMPTAERSQASSASLSPVTTVGTASHGYVLSLSIRGTTFPRNALVRVIVRVENRRDVETELAPGQAGVNPFAEVVSAQGAIVYPPPLTPPPAFLPEGPPSYHLLPHSAITTQQLVILRGTKIKAAMPVSDPDPNGFGRMVVTTPPIHLTLTHERAPAVAVSTSTGSPMAQVHPASLRQGGSLHVFEWFRCRPEDPVYRYRGWYSLGPARVVRPTCSSPVFWEAVLGWVNHPVTHFTYRVPSVAPTADRRRAASDATVLPAGGLIRGTGYDADSEW